jgi:hypothetical protein
MVLHEPAYGVLQVLHWGTVSELYFVCAIPMFQETCCQPYFLVGGSVSGCMFILISRQLTAYVQC